MPQSPTLKKNTSNQKEQEHGTVTEREKLIFEVEMFYIDKSLSIIEKFYYLFLTFFGVLLITIISNPESLENIFTSEADYFFIKFLFKIGLFVLICYSLLSLGLLYSDQKDLINKIKQNRLADSKKFSSKKLFKKK